MGRFVRRRVAAMGITASCVAEALAREPGAGRIRDERLPELDSGASPFQAFALRQCWSSPSRAKTLASDSSAAGSGTTRMSASTA